MEIIVID